jgi:hypothetical protein
MIKVQFVGGAPLTNVVLVFRLKTRGPVTTPGPGAPTIFAFNKAWGYGDKNNDIAFMFMTKNYLKTMPKGDCAYAACLQQGDIVHVPMGESDEGDTLIGGTISLYCDEGYLPEKDVTYSRVQPGTKTTPVTKPARVKRKRR